jgi:dolichol-phosphate mannosyltransferase
VLAPPALSVVAPCYNESETLPEFVRRVRAVCENVCAGDYEIVLVNDGSSDRTWETMRLLARGTPELVGVNLSRNHGHQLALSAGLATCRGERILIIDADLQDPPELLPQMMQVMDTGVDVVYGQRESRRGESFFKLATATAFYRMLDSLTDVRIPLDTGDFRLMSRRALQSLLAMPEQHRFIRGMVTWIGLRQEPLRYVRDVRFAGETHYPLAKMIRFGLDAITGFSVKPLRIATYAGALCAAFSMLLLVYTAWAWFVHRTIQGWTSLMGVVLLLGSVQLLVMGVFGEYLGRLFMEAKRRPLFTIESIVTGTAAQAVPSVTPGVEASAASARGIAERVK